MGELVEQVDEDDHVVAVVERRQAIHRSWLHRIATTICRDPHGSILGVRFRVTEQGIDTSTSAGRLFFKTWTRSPVRGCS